MADPGRAHFPLWGRLPNLPWEARTRRLGNLRLANAPAERGLDLGHRDQMQMVGHEPMRAPHSSDVEAGMRMGVPRSRHVSGSSNATLFMANLWGRANLRVGSRRRRIASCRSTWGPPTLG